jgi:anti-sigma factor RsiW
VPNSPAHLTESALEQLAEGMLPETAAAQANEHLERCARCRSELEVYSALMSALSNLPRFAPSAEFADTVMARVKIAPAPDPIYARFIRWLPNTRRGWTILLGATMAPALPVIALVAWVLTQPLVSAGGLVHWGASEAVETLRLAAGQLLEWGAGLGVISGAQGLYTSIATLPLGTVTLVVGILSVAIPLSAWSLVRLIRPPMANVTYAN